MSFTHKHNSSLRGTPLLKQWSCQCHIRAGIIRILIISLVLSYAYIAASIHCHSLLQLFCQRTRALMGASGAYFWKLDGQSFLIGEAADGCCAEVFVGKRVETNHSLTAGEALRLHRASFLNHVEPREHSWEKAFNVKSVVSAPVITDGLMTGILAFTHTADTDFFEDGSAAMATVVAAQLGTLLERARLVRTSDQHRQRAEDLMSLALQLGSSLRLPDFVRS